MTARETRARGWLVKFWLPSNGVRLLVYARIRGKERKRKRESYIQNSWDKAELSDLAVAMAGAYERPRKSTSGRKDQEGGVQVVTCKFEP